MFHLKCECTDKSCPVYGQCCFLPTECYPDPDGCVEILFVGQGGGKDERKRKRPFIGRAGKRLRQIISYIRHSEGHFGVALGNTVRDNPEGNRAPNTQELEHCIPHLFKDIEKLKESGLKIVVPLGNPSRIALLGDKDASMSGTHGTLNRLSNVDDVIFMPTYHPSFLVRKSLWRYKEKGGMEPPDYDKIVIKDIKKCIRHIRDKDDIEEITGIDDLIIN